MKRFITHHTVKPESLDAYLDAALAMVAAARRTYGVHSLDLLQDTGDPTRFHLVEAYFHEGGYEDYIASEAYRAWQDALEKLDPLAGAEVRIPVESLRPEERDDPEVSPGDPVYLREVNDDNVGAVLALRVSEAQDSFVAPNTRSLAQAYAAGGGAWVRAIYADEIPVGFVMLSINLEKSRYYLWRYMIDRRYQGMGFGRRALEQLIAYVRTLPNATEMFLSYAPGEGSPKGFYEKLGFEDTGVQHGREFEMRLAL